MREVGGYGDTRPDLPRSALSAPLARRRRCPGWQVLLARCMVFAPRTFPPSTGRHPESAQPSRPLAHSPPGRSPLAHGLETRDGAKRQDRPGVKCRVSPDCPVLLARCARTGTAGHRPCLELAPWKWSPTLSTSVTGLWPAHERSGLRPGLSSQARLLRYSLGAYPASHPS